VSVPALEQHSLELEWLSKLTVLEMPISLAAPLLCFWSRCSAFLFVQQQKLPSAKNSGPTPPIIPENLYKHHNRNCQQRTDKHNRNQ